MYVLGQYQCWGYQDTVPGDCQGSRFKLKCNHTCIVVPCCGLCVAYFWIRSTSYIHTGTWCTCELRSTNSIDKQLLPCYISIVHIHHHRYYAQEEGCKYQCSYRIGQFVNAFSMAFVSLSPRLPCMPTWPAYMLGLFRNTIAISVVKRTIWQIYPWAHTAYQAAYQRKRLSYASRQPNCRYLAELINPTGARCARRSWEANWQIPGSWLLPHAGASWTDTNQ